MTETIKAPVKTGGANARVLKQGDGKISKGTRINSERQYYAKGDHVTLPDDVAAELEDRGYVELL